MEFQICSDLHLEFSENRKWIKNHPLTPQAEILLIAGDTYYLNRTLAKLDLIKQVARDFKQVYILPGNHEYYEGYDLATALEPVNIPVMDNVSLLNNTTVTIGGVNLIFSTLWTVIAENKEIIESGVVDFRRIRFGDQKLTASHVNQLHSKALDFIATEAAKPGKKIVVSHHLPSALCTHQEFIGSPLNDAFCVDLTDFIRSNSIAYWVYGHSHRNMPDLIISDTTLVTNQLGYVRIGEHLSFNTERVISI
ncbi:metallophosphoesterase [Roseivirga sp. BDSF3-8]|uniref:metallophosphoesterase n=1 Tax=Roseivirga sp. BDSF3-8 TaxID=3241598 RepID=UPI0035317EA3